jgi:hypothetical protein
LSSSPQSNQEARTYAVGVTGLAVLSGINADKIVFSGLPLLKCVISKEYQNEKVLHNKKYQNEKVLHGRTSRYDGFDVDRIRCIGARASWG